MIQLLSAYFIYAIGRFFSGMEDGDVSITEIELAQSRGRVNELSESIYLRREKDTVRRKRWHRNGAIKLLLTVTSISLFTYGFSASTALLFVSLLNLQVLIFNPVIAVKYLNQNFFYISPNGWDGIFDSMPKLYYFTNLAVFLACVYFLL